MKKLLVIGFILLFLLMNTSSSKVNDDIRMENTTIEKSEILQLDNYIEIITKLDGYINAFELKGIGIGVNIEMWSYWSGIELNGWRFYNQVFPLENWSFDGDAKHVIIPNFIGYIGHPCDQSNTRELHGIAIGNFEWE